MKDFVSLILKKEGRWKSKTNKGGGAIHTFQEKASEFNLTFWTSSRTLSVQANDANKEKLLNKFERLMIHTNPEEVTQVEFAKHRPDKKIVKENHTENLGEPPKPHQKDKSVNYNDELKNVWAVLNEMKATLNLLCQDRGFKIDEQTPQSNKESVSENSNGNLSTEKNTNQSKGKREKLITDYFRKVSVTQLQQMNDHKKFVELKEKLQQVEMEKNILIDKIRVLTKENTELKKLQGSAVGARTESTQKILKAKAKNKREDRAQDKPEVSQQRKAPTANPTAQHVIMENGEDQVSHRTRMQQRYKGRDGRQGLVSNRQTVVICGDSMVKGLHGWMMSYAKVKVQSFPGATCGDMDHYLQPIISRGPDHVILHVGTNDLSSSKPEEVVSKIISLTNKLKEHGINVIVSSLIIRSDPLNDRVIKVNEPLKANADKFEIVEHSNTSGTHLNGSGLHLKKRGDGALALNFIKCIRGPDESDTPWV